MFAARFSSTTQINALSLFLPLLCPHFLSCFSESTPTSTLKTRSHFNSHSSFSSVIPSLLLPHRPLSSCQHDKSPLGLIPLKPSTHCHVSHYLQTLWVSCRCLPWKSCFSCCSSCLMMMILHFVILDDRQSVMLSLSLSTERFSRWNSEKSDNHETRKKG